MLGPSWYRGSSPFVRSAGRPGLSPLLDGQLVVGEYPTPADAVWLREEHRIDAVVSLQDDADLASKNLRLAELVQAYAEAGIAFHHHPVADGDAEDLARSLPAILARLEELLAAGRRVYVHCNAGFNRAPTVAIAYLRAHRGMSHEEAWRSVKERRSCAPYRRALELFFGEPVP
ncbi:MAG TPA: dual specificity protein phosphatase family protein [Candidatus Binatia bacterium]